MSRKRTAHVVERLPFAKYVEVDAVHASSLKRMAVSPLAYRSYISSEDSDSDTLRQGRAAHTAVLEPVEFLGSYVLWRGGTRRGKEWDEFVAKAGSCTILTESQYETAKRIGDAVRAHKVASRLLTGGRAEVSIKWKHQRLGVLIKCRLDYVSGSALVDLKTTRDPSPAKFASSAASLAYDMQLALYADAAAAAGLGSLPCKLVAVQSSEPFDVVVYDVPEDVLNVGREKYERALDLYVACTKSGIWPGQAPDEEVTLHLPAWAQPEAEEEALTFNGASVF